MKCNINNVTLTCQKQPRYCTGCHFKMSRDVCSCSCHLLNILCFRRSLIFLRTDVSDIFDL